MGNLISKVWWFKPNAHTTYFELHATFTDNTTSVYAFRKVGASWEPTGESHDDRLVIMLPGNEYSSFIVRTYDNDPYMSITPVYGNGHMTVTSDEIQLTRIHFPTEEEFDINDVVYISGDATQYEPAWNLWEMFDRATDLQDIFVSSLTESITLPPYKLPHAYFDGWCILDETADPIKVQFPGTDVNPKYRVKSSWYRLMQSRSNPWNEVGLEDTEDSRGLKTLLSKASLNGTYRMIPIGYSSGDWSYVFTAQN